MTEYRVPTTAKVAGMIAAHADLLEQHGISSGLESARPAVGTAKRYYFCTDSKKWCRDNGTSWDEVSGLSEEYIQGLIDASVADALVEAAADATSKANAAYAAAVDQIAVDGNLSVAAQEAVSERHPAPTYDAVNGEVVFEI